MWCFKGRNGFCVYILPNRKKSFGKLSSDIKLEGDATISRLHAIVSVEPTGELDTQYKCVINDISKYGTFVIRDGKKLKLSKNDAFLLKIDDIVQFGLKETTFVVQYHSFVTVKSSLNEEELNRLKNIIDHIGGQLLETWENSCTHLTAAKSILFTTKLACALASAKPIVTIKYWEAVNLAIEESKELPKTETFLPIIKEDWLKVSPRLFLPNEKRRTLFRGLSFVYFCAKQYHTYASLIIAAGGKSCVYPTKRPLTPRDLTAKNAIVIQQPISDSTLLTQEIAADYEIVYHKLQAIKRRLVSDTEIPLAILYCSTERYCNPKFNFATILKSKSQAFSSTDIVIIEDTQNIDKVENEKIKRKVIPETVESISKKVCFSNDSDQINDSNANKSIVEDTQVANVEKINYKIIAESSDFEDSDRISKKAHSSNESEQKNISDGSSVAPKAKNDKDVPKNVWLSNESSERSIPGSSNNIAYNIFTKQLQIIPESCSSSSEKDVSNNSCNKNEKQVSIIPETCDFNEKNITDNLVTEMQQNVFQEKESVEKCNLISVENNQEKNILQGNKVGLQGRENILTNEENHLIQQNNNIFSVTNDQQQKDKLQDSKLKYQQSKIIFTNDENNLALENSDVSCEKTNMIVEQDKMSNQRKSTDSENYESSKNSKKPRIISIQETDNIGICVRRNNKNLPEKSCSRVEKSQDLSEKKNLNCVFNTERREEGNLEDGRATENKIQETYIKTERRRKGDNWYNKYLNGEFTDEILRKDIPCGKKFTKTYVMIPKRVLKRDDFIS